MSPEIILFVYNEYLSLLKQNAEKHSLTQREFDPETETTHHCSSENRIQVFDGIFRFCAGRLVSYHCV